MTTPKAWIQLACNTAHKMCMVGMGSMLAETDEMLAANVLEMRKNVLSVLDMLSSAAAELERRRDGDAQNGAEVKP